MMLGGFTIFKFELAIWELRLALLGFRFEFGVDRDFGPFVGVAWPWIRVRAGRRTVYAMMESCRIWWFGAMLERQVQALRRWWRDCGWRVR